MSRICCNIYAQSATDCVEPQLIFWPNWQFSLIQLFWGATSSMLLII